jgi:hypothetical protein
MWFHAAFVLLLVFPGVYPSPLTGWSRKGDKSMDWQLESGSQWLIFLLGKRALGYLPSAEMRKELEQTISNTTSIWNPSDPEYPLRNGCR